jgi:hypothetical protein
MLPVMWCSIAAKSDTGTSQDVLACEGIVDKDIFIGRYAEANAGLRGEDTGFDEVLEEFEDLFVGRDVIGMDWDEQMGIEDIH